MPKINVDTVETRTGTGYPAPFDELVAPRIKQVLGDGAGLTDFGVNLVRLPPGAWSSQRHWHSHEDEFIWIVSGEATLVTNAGEQLMRAGDCAAFPKATPDGHHLINRSGAEVVYLEVGSRFPEDVTEYPDIDMRFEGVYRRRNGEPY
jgi:uncharacterized cupin superfamily protein